MLSFESGLSVRTIGETLVKNLGSTFHLRLPTDLTEFDKLVGKITFHLSSVGPSNAEDLCSWIMLECLKEKSEGIEVDWPRVIRIADRIRHRIVRQASRVRYLSDQMMEPASDTDPSFEIDLKEIISKLKYNEFVIYHSYFLNGEGAAEIGRELGISKSEVYRNINKIRNMIVKKI